MAKFTLKIYIACLSSYNNGILHGEWLDVVDKNQVWEGIKQVLKTSPMYDAEEWAIHDYEVPEGIRLSEYQSIDSIIELSKLLEEHGEIVGLLYSDSPSDLDYIRESLEDRFIGIYDSVENYAQELISEQEVPEHLSYYIDHKRYAQDLLVNDIREYRLDGQSHLFYQG